MIEQTSEEKARHPAEVATRETVRFVRAHLSGGVQRLLEVGCGNGALAAALQADGHTLIALDACGVLQADSFGHAILAGGGALAPWQHEHAHELHTAQAMAQAIQARFQGFYGAAAPYLYRYISRMVADTEAGAAVVEHVLALETKLGMVREKSLLGRRFVARKHGVEGY